MAFEHLRRAESARISDDARTRLEGKVELLEDALALIDSVDAALAREVQSTDDASTLREFANQLERIDAALASVDALPDGSGAELTALVKQRRSSVANALTQRLGVSDQPLEQRLLAAAQDIVSERTTPPPDATRFRESRIRSELGFLFGGIALGVYLIITLWDGDHGKYPYFWWLGVAAIVVTLARSRRRPAWQLFADGVFAHGRMWPLRSGTLHRKTSRRSAVVSFGENLELEGDDTFRVIELLRAPKLAGLERVPVSKWSRAGRRFKITSPQGVLIIEADQVAAICSALGNVQPVSGEDLSEVLAHLPARRLREVGEWLATDQLATFSAR